jgi:hypothetical protein
MSLATAAQRGGTMIAALKDCLSKRRNRRVAFDHGIHADPGHCDRPEYDAHRLRCRPSHRSLSELFETHIGTRGLGLQRGLNRLWTDGGMMISWLWQ